MKIVSGTIGLDEVKGMAAGMFGDLVKAVVDIDRKLLALDGELHSDLEALLLQIRDRHFRDGLWPAPSLFLCF